MKKLTIIVGILLIVAMSASAQLPKPLTFYADGGITVPNGDMNTLYKSGMHLAVGVGFDVAPMFQVVPTIEYHSFGSDFGTGFSGGDMTVWMLGANGRMNVGAGPMPLKPFFLGGIGFARGSVEAIKLLATQVSPDASTTNFYWNIGAGVEMGSLFLQAKYVSIASDGSATNYIPVSLGLKF